MGPFSSPFFFFFFFFLHSLLPFTEVLKIYNVLNPTLTLYSISSPISWCDEPGRSSVICIKTISSVTQAQIEFPEFQELQAPGKGIGKAIKKKKKKKIEDLPGGASGSKAVCQCRRHTRCGFYSQVRKLLQRRAWQMTPVFLPGESHGQRSPESCSPWSRKESDTTEAT